MAMTPNQAELILIRCIASAITHVNELKVRRPQNVISPVEAVGMFATALRRELISSLAWLPNGASEVRKFCQTISKPHAWHDVGKPKINYNYSYPWTFDIPLEGGIWKMNNLHADHICRTASIQASYGSDDAETTIEINRSLNELEAGLRNMRAGVTVAAGINVQAEQVLDNLCQVAEKLIA